MKILKYAVLIPPFFFISIFSASAQEQDTLRVEMEPIEINAIRSAISATSAPLSLSIQSFSSRQRNASLSLTMDQITAQLPGIMVSDRQNYALGERISIRGMGWRAAFGVRGIQVIMDGIPLTVADGQAMLNSVDPSFISEIELVRGPAATFWGNSSGGVLYLSTIRPQNDAPSLSMRSSMGSFGTTKQDIQFSGSFGRHQIAGYGSYLYDGGFRNHSSAKVARTGLRGTIALTDDSRLEYMGAFVGMPQAQHPSALNEENAHENPQMAVQNFVDHDAGKQVYQGQFGLNYHHNTSIGTLTLTGYGIHRDLTNPLPFGIINIDRWAGGLRGTIRKSFDNVTINAGFDSKFQRDNRLETDNENGSAGAVQLEQLETVTNQAIFATSTLSLGNFDILGGLRFDWLTFYADPEGDDSGKRIFQSLNPSIGIAYNWSNQKLYSNFSTSFEAPTTTELVNNPDPAQQSGFNPNLQPEQTVGIEAGSEGLLGSSRLHYDIALFQIWIQDLLFPYQLQSGGPEYYRNEGKTIHRGIESSLSYHLTNSFSMNLTYNYTRATFENPGSENTELEGNRVPGIPDHRFNIGAEYSSSNWLISASYQLVNDYPADNENTAFNEAYGVTNGKLSYIYSFPNSDISIQPFLNIRNLFDIRYNSSVAINAFGGRYFEPAPGRNWQAGLSINFN